MKKLFLVDGSSFLYRAFYALPFLSSSKGLPTHAIYGFARMINRILKEYDPEYIAVVFDVGRETFRTEKFKEYKAHRPRMPDELAIQIPYIKRLLNAYGIKILELPRFEADDIIGTISEKAKERGFSVVIISPDKDLLQLVDKNTLVYDPMADKMYNELEVIKKFGVHPRQIPDFLALVGDSSDNIPGVKGIGKKKALELLSKFENIEKIYERLDSLKPVEKKKLIEGKEAAFLSKELATIRKDLPLEIEIEELKKEKPDYEELRNLYIQLEFSSLLKELPEKQLKEIKANYKLITTPQELHEIKEKIKNEFSLDFETTSLDPLEAEIAGIAICTEEGESFYIPLLHPDVKINSETALLFLEDLLLSAKTKIGQNLKYELSILLAGYNFRPSPPIFDTMIASYLLNPLKRSHKLDEIALEYLGYRMISYKEVTKDLSDRENFSHLKAREAFYYACEDADITYRLKQKLEERLKEEELLWLFENIEMPLVPVLARMEVNGVKVDVIKLELMKKFLEEKIELCKREIYNLAGEKFNINSTRQLAKILFEKLKLKPVKRTKTGYSTDTEVLETLSFEHPLPAKVLEYRQLTKLKSTYVDGLIQKIHPRTGRIHTSYNQTATATGRLSSSDPNLQNIPIRTELGKMIRDTFIAEEGYVLVGADYSQIELRILAAMAGEERLIEAFEKGEDIHTKTACELFGITPDKVDSELRRRAKTVNFGIIYGISPYGLSKELGISVDEAKKYIDRYFERYPKVVEFIEKTTEKARQNGFVTTFFGRKRPVPELFSPKREEREFGKRIAINTPIQGTAADIIKLAMIKAQEFIDEKRLDAKMILQVHDELVFEVKESIAKDFSRELKRIMENVCPEINVPLKVDIGIGKSWGEL